MYRAAPKYAGALPQELPIPLTKMYYPVTVECTFVPPKLIQMFIDPAGGGADELAFGVSTAVGPYVHVLDCGGLKGGLSGDNPEILCSVIAENKVTDITVESNMGHGLFEINLRAELAKRGLAHVQVKGEYSTGQKERRIIDSIVSPMQRHRVIVHRKVFESDIKYGKQHSAEARTQYSLWYQLANITTDRNSLPHDDRLEAFAGCVRLWKNVLAVDENKAAAARAQSEVLEYLANPMGYENNLPPRSKGTRRITQGRPARK